MKDEKIEFIFNSFPEFANAVEEAKKQYNEADEDECEAKGKRAYIMSRAMAVVSVMVEGCFVKHFDFHSNNNVMDLSGAGVAFLKMPIAGIKEANKWNDLVNNFIKDKNILEHFYDDESRYYFFIFRRKTKNEN